MKEFIEIYNLGKAIELKFVFNEDVEINLNIDDFDIYNLYNKPVKEEQKLYFVINAQNIVFEKNFTLDNLCAKNIYVKNRLIAKSVFVTNNIKGDCLVSNIVKARNIDLSVLRCENIECSNILKVNILQFNNTMFEKVKVCHIKNIE